jgi:glycine cleavage system H protein|tara:strand:- start:205 stop:588 length:384 start_codon:yes stop_codon:yes gene_type:complete
MIVNVPKDLLFTDEHEWVKIDDNIATIGITDYAQRELGDIVFIEFPSLNSNYNKGESMGTIEAVKTVADIFMPISGQIIELNDVLNDNPETVNNNPFNDGWILKLQIKDMGEVSDLMDSKKYKTFIS